MNRRFQQKYLIGYIFLFLIANFLPVSGAAQQLNEQRVAELRDPYQIPPMFYKSDINISIDVNISEMSIDQALRLIAEKAKLKLTYRGDIIVNKKVTLKAQDISVSDALNQVLKSVPLDYRFSRDRYLLIVPTEKTFKKAVATEVSGTVTDGNTGNTLPGVNILVKGTSSGTSTDANGHYEVSVASLQDTLVFSFVGYATKEVPINGRATVDVEMQSQAITGEEMVVIGYGEQKKSSLTGSISSVSGDELNDREASSSNPLDLLQGKLSGVNVTSNNGKPGSGVDIKVRGIGSINNSSPLVIVDGVRRSASDLNSQNIASVQVLKDAAASAIYGAQAANGVILITTKTGQEDQSPLININTTVGVREAAGLPDMLGTPDFIALGTKAKQNAGSKIPESWQSYSNGDITLPNTDWMKEVFQPGLQQHYNLSVSGGGSNNNYYVAGGYKKNNGIQYSNSYEQYNFRVNTNFDVTDRIGLGETLNLKRSIRRPTTGNRVIPFRPIPVVPLRDESNSLGGWGQGPTYWSGGNPVGQAHRAHQKNYGNTIAGNIFAHVDILKSLTIKANLALNYHSGRTSYYQQKYNWGNSQKLNNSYEIHLGTGNNYDGTLTLNYERSFEKHHIKALAGYEAYKTEGQNLGGTGLNFSVSNPRSLILAGTTPTVSDLTTQSDPYRLLSQFGRISYDYDNTYLLQVNFRRDASSKFSPTHKAGNFPGISAGWRISNESFMDDLSFLSNLKIRGSWGVLGSDQSISNFAYIQTYNSKLGTQTPEVAFGDQIKRGNHFGGFPSNDIKWEQIKQTDIGVDIALFERSLNATIDYYIKNTTDMLFGVSLPPSSGGNNIPVNIGKMQNKGLNFSITYQNNVDNFTYKISANASHNTNEVQKLSEDQYLFKGGAYTLDGNTSRTQVGHPLSSFYGYKTNGIFKSQEQVNEYNARAQTKNGPDAYYQQKKTSPGDLIYADLNGDGQVTPEDRTFIGNPWPEWTYGLNFNFGYKSISLGMLFQGVQNVDILNANKAILENFFADFNSSVKAFDAWNTDHPNRTQPRLNATDPNGNFSNPSEYLVEDGSYLKLRNLRLGYTLPVSSISTIGVDKVKIFVNAQNVFTITGYSGLWPEVAGGNTARGIDYSRYPQTRLFTGGVNISF